MKIPIFLVLGINIRYSGDNNMISQAVVLEEH